jgi:hypothetical protein
MTFRSAQNKANSLCSGIFNSQRSQPYLSFLVQYAHVLVASEFVVIQEGHQTTA